MKEMLTSRVGMREERCPERMLLLTNERSASRSPRKKKKKKEMPEKDIK